MNINFDQIDLVDSKVFEKTIFIKIEFYPGRNDIYQNFDGFRAIRMFPDEDFCIYRNFPFEKLIVITKLDLKLINNMDDLNNKHHISCTFEWINKYVNIYFKFINDANLLYLRERDNFSIIIAGCEFAQKYFFNLDMIYFYKIFCNFTFTVGQLEKCIYLQSSNYFPY